MNRYFFGNWNNFLITFDFFSLIDAHFNDRIVGKMLDDKN